MQLYFGSAEWGSRYLLVIDFCQYVKVKVCASREQAYGALNSYFRCCVLCS